MAEARRLWAEEEGDVIDDCTVIVALLECSAPVRTVNLTVGAGISIPLGVNIPSAQPSALPKGPGVARQLPGRAGSGGIGPRMSHSAASSSSRQRKSLAPLSGLPSF